MNFPFLRKQLLLLFAFFMQGANLLFAQVLSPLFHQYSTEEGLASSEVYDVLEDASGVMWFGTDKGLARFDGYEFKTYTSKDGLTDNTVFNLRSDHRGRVWMQTYSGRLFYFDAGKIQPFAGNSILSDSTKSRIPTGFDLDDPGNVIVSLQNVGEICIDTVGKVQWYHTSANSPGVNYMIDEIKPGALVNTLIDPFFSNGSFTVKYIRGKNTSSITLNVPFANRFNALRMKNEHLLVSIGNVLVETDGKNVLAQKTFNGHVIEMFQDDKLAIWIGTVDGLYLFDDGKIEHEFRHYLDGIYITGILEDREGGMWISSLNGGVYYTPGCGILGIQYKEEQLRKPISIASDGKESVYAGFWTGAVIRIRNNTTSVMIDPLKMKTDQPINRISIFPDDDKVYISCYRPCYLLGESIHFFKSPGILGLKTKFLQFQNKEFFVAASGTVFRMYRDSLSLVYPTDQRVNCIGETKDGNLLIGSNRGLYVVDAQSGKLKLYHSALNDVRVDDIQYCNDMLVLATKGRGVVCLLKDSVLTIDESEGLCSDLVNKILVTGNELWCATNKGIAHILFTQQKEHPFVVRNIQSSNGLLSDETNDLAVLKDTLYAVSNSGLSFFPLGIDFDNRIPPSVNIDQIRVNDSVYSLQSLMELNHSSNNLEMNFTGISFRSMGKLIYRYELINGSDTLSSITSNRQVQFFSLLPGKYIFRVKAKNTSGIWSSEAATISFVVMPAWWQTKLFALIIAVFTGLILLFIYLNRMKKIRQRFDNERRQASLQLTAMRAQMNPHFIFNVMNSIRNFMQNKDSRSAERYLTSFAKLIRYTLDNSEAQEVSLEAELQALKNYAELEMQRFEQGFDFTIECEEGLDLNEYSLPSLLLQPFVENSIKHGIGRLDKGGKITLKISKLESGLRIIIEDNGVGVNVSKEWNRLNRADHISFGTSLTHERIQAYNKAFNKSVRASITDLIADDGTIAGTRVEIII